MTHGANSITLLRAKQPLAKQFAADGSEVAHSLARQHQFKSVTPTSWDDVLQVVRWMETDRYTCMVCGMVADHVQPSGWYRRLKFDRGSDAATCLDRHIQMLPFDIDGLELDTGGCSSSEEIARLVVDRVMQDIGYPSTPTAVFQWSGSAGLKPGVRMRLLLWNEVPVPLERMAVLAQNVPYLDASIYEPHQPIYWSAPLFDDPAMDPFRGSPRSGVAVGEPQSFIPPGATLLQAPAHLGAYTTGTSSLSTAAPPAPERKDPALEALRSAGMVLDTMEPGKVKIRCPWSQEHSDPTQVEAAYFEANYNGFDRPSFVCLHNTCRKASRDHTQLVGWLQQTGLTAERIDPHGSPRGPERGGAGYPDVSKKNENGVWVADGIKGTERNVRKYLSHVGLRVRFNALSSEVEIMGWLKPLSGAAALSWLIDAMHREGLPNPQSVVTRAIDAIAQDDIYHPFDDWWAALPAWDGQDYIERLAGTLTTENDLWWRSALRLWLTQVAQTTAEPGKEPAELVLTFVGGQGVGKTRWFRSLLPDQFVRGSTYLDPTNKDSVIAATAPIICELGELDAMLPGKSAHARNEVFKAFMSQHVDRYRPPYGRSEIMRPRRTVFGGSTNEREFLTDPTGSRRFLPIVAHTIDWQHGIDLAQLWAQVAHEHAHGAQWWADRETQTWLRTYAQEFRDHSPVYLDTISLLEETGRPPMQVVGSAHPPRGYVAVSTSTIARVLGLDAGRTSSRVTREIGHALRDWTGQDPRAKCAGVRRSWIVPWSPSMNIAPEVLRQQAQA